MKSADDGGNPLVPADALGLLDNIADTGMRAAGNDDQPLFRPISQRRIVAYEIAFPLAADLRLTDRTMAFKGIGLFDFSLIRQLRAEP